jgi:hypothetical protein
MLIQVFRAFGHLPETAQKIEIRSISDTNGSDKIAVQPVRFVKAGFSKQFRALHSRAADSQLYTSIHGYPWFSGQFN